MDTAFLPLKWCFILKVNHHDLLKLLAFENWQNFTSIIQQQDIFKKMKLTMGNGIHDEMNI